MTDTSNIVVLDPQANGAGWEHINATPEDGIFTATREEWCVQVCLALLPELAKLGITMVGSRRQIRIAVAPLSASKWGICYSSAKSIDRGTNLLTISSDLVAPIDLVHVIAHELLHALDDCRSGHKGRWKRWADTLGIPIRGVDRSPDADALFRSVLSKVGIPARHVPTNPQKRQQRKSQVRFICTSCGGHVHMPAAIAEAGAFKLLCTVCNRQLEQAH
jgi:hypothetical protein